VKTYGKKVWIFPDAELPPKGVNVIPGHESIIITNTGTSDAEIRITYLYEDSEPIMQKAVIVRSQRVRCLRTNSISDFPEKQPVVGEQYAIVVESNVPIVAQYGRAETREVNFYTTPGYCED